VIPRRRFGHASSRTAIEKPDQPVGALHTNNAGFALNAKPIQAAILMQRSEGQSDLAHLIEASTFHLQSRNIWQL
jgi:hypothetical protein